ncbi:type III-B CRISPR module RAMP protein Cmr4 [Meiothermus ruber]|uniref:CRISPR-associated RAMP protein, Cmr4 family n=1 Tax=Meiothermus ruber (strain ATCC 35948 / DSM 1279 / VKM B-1258 / 21) TaxID=504728 RepID=D3PS11_MEIRD|nr:type III-B CRISPR module RAMP protein Cmr4 [Meiothermus ruber]ADD28244.1 CRISPR-associated RAMP protein, Cmr4 family [Meiothermus ruber DSM 1279]AGK06316.1 Cmr4 family CRISPR-associated RAMP protein [Meiothermus ruber DSM 1279]
MQTKAFFLQALTPVHPGTGQVSGSVIDLPVAREAATGFPLIPASSLKGVLRDGRADEAANKIFGSLEQMGELTLTDARLLLLPVRSYAGTFALITCPLVLQRWQRDAEALAGSAIQYNNQVILEDIDLKVKGSSEALAKAISGLLFGKEEPDLMERLALVSNDVFSYFCQTGLEVIARVRLESASKTVASGALWYEEAIPAEAVFSSFALAKDAAHFAELHRRPYLQIGGEASVGRGLLRVLGGV